MRKTFLFTLLLLWVSMRCLAASSQHPFEVKRLSYWAPEYLTWTCGYYYWVEPNEEKGNISAQLKFLERFGLKEDGYLYIDEEQSTNIPRIGDIITEIDGHSTRNMSESVFFDIVSKANSHVIKYISKNKPAIAQIVIKDNSEWLNVLGFNVNGKDRIDRALNWYTMAGDRKQLPGTLDVIFDTDVDWSKYHTYDFAIRGNDPLNDKLLLNKVVEAFDGWLVRDENNPDLLFTIAKSSDQSINTTYVPPVVENIRTGSTTSTRYNWITRQNDYVTKEKYTTTQRDGYTKQDKLMNLFLEFTILDAKKIKEVKTTTPPIVYQGTYNRSVLNGDFSPKDEYLSICTWLKYPIYERMSFGKRVTERFCPSGMFAHQPVYQDIIVDKVIPGSDADKAGIMDRDHISKFKSKDGNYILTIKRGKNKFTATVPYSGTFIFPLEDNLVVNIPMLEK